MKFRGHTVEGRGMRDVYGRYFGGYCMALLDALDDRRCPLGGRRELAKVPRNQCKSSALSLNTIDHQERKRIPTCPYQTAR